MAESPCFLGLLLLKLLEAGFQPLGFALYDVSPKPIHTVNQQKKSIRMHLSLGTHKESKHHSAPDLWAPGTFKESKNSIILPSLGPLSSTPYTLNPTP